MDNYSNNIAKLKKQILPYFPLYLDFSLIRDGKFRRFLFHVLCIQKNTRKSFSYNYHTIFIETNFFKHLNKQNLNILNNNLKYNSLYSLIGLDSEGSRVIHFFNPLNQKNIHELKLYFCVRFKLYNLVQKIKNEIRAAGFPYYIQNNEIYVNHD